MGDFTKEKVRPLTLFERLGWMLNRILLVFVFNRSSPSMLLEWAFAVRLLIDLPTVASASTAELHIWILVFL